ncbi:porin family protein [Hymenobacter yonginensis]|uniref:Porin family protein n=1 Tax=Hymenobacter yonginensis TaxID=748197 RepID=A0ABY7PT11_9BACT|nr:porin family protein [Hymenobacter yonginensis]WBO85979.1 porin family protein [Hymenobacter yonginensis]
MHIFLRHGLLGSALLLSATTGAQAQLTFGPRVGLNATTIHYDFGDCREPETSLHTGLQAGLSLNAQFGKLAVQPSLLYSQRGGKSTATASDTYADTTRTFDFRNTTRLHYLELPVNLVYSTKGAQGGFQVFAGPYVALGLGGRQTTDMDVTIQAGAQRTTYADTFFQNVDFTNKRGEVSQVEYLQALDAGLNFGVGYKLGGLQAQLGYGLGLRNMILDYPDGRSPMPEGKSYNRGLHFSLAYFLG